MNMVDEASGWYAARRAVAFCIDAAVVWLLVALFAAISGGHAGPFQVIINAAIFLLYRVLAGAWLGTVGRQVLGLRLVSTEPRSSWPLALRGLFRELPFAMLLVSLRADLLTGFVLLFSGAPLLLAGDLACVLIRGDGRSLRDLLAGTSVVIQRAGHHSDVTPDRGIS